MAVCDGDMAAKGLHKHLAGETAHLRGGLSRQPTYMPSPGVVSDKASILRSASTTSGHRKVPNTHQPAFQRKADILTRQRPATTHEDFDHLEYYRSFSSAAPERTPFVCKPPPRPIRPHFPGDIFEALGLPPSSPTRSDFPGDVFEPRHLKSGERSPPAAPSPSLSEGVQNEPTDPYHRPIHDAYPHVFRPKATPQPKPKLRRNESSGVFATAGTVFKGFMTTVRSFAASRNKANVRKSGSAMSMPVAGSFLDFHPRTYEQKNILHAGVKAIPGHKAQKEFAGHSGPSTGAQGPIKSRTVKVIGDPNRGTMWEDFQASDLFDDTSSEGSVELPQAQPPMRRNRGSSKPLAPLPPGVRDSDILHNFSSGLPPPRDSTVSQLPVVEVVTAIPAGWERPPPPHPRPDKRVDTSRYSWIPDINCQKPDEYDLDAIRAKSAYEVPDFGDYTPSTAVQRTVSRQQGAQQLTSQRPVLNFDLTSPVDWEEIHRGKFPSNHRLVFDPQVHSNVEMPRLDDESPSTDALFDDITEAKLIRSCRNQHLEAVRSRDSTAIVSQRWDKTDATVDRMSDDIDEAVDHLDTISESLKPWASEDLHHMDNQMKRERRKSDGSIVIDTFPHNAHTSWRATERPDDHTVHRDRHRFTRDFHGTGDGQDADGLLMQRLERQMMDG